MFILRAFLMCLLMTGLCLHSLPTQAKDKKEKSAEDEGRDDDGEEKADAPADPKRFAPDFCDFEITFPEKPTIANKCLPDGKCYDVNSYIMVYDLHTTVDVSVTCNPSTPANYTRYTDQVMKAALTGMIDERNLDNHDIQFRQMDKVKNASLTGTGMTGREEKIYTAQLWIGPNSVFTVQAELIGGAHEQADKAFRDILSSIKVKDGKQVPRPTMPVEKTNH